MWFCYRCSTRPRIPGPEFASVRCECDRAAGRGPRGGEGDEEEEVQEGAGDGHHAAHRRHGQRGGGAAAAAPGLATQVCIRIC